MDLSFSQCANCGDDIWLTPDDSSLTPESEYWENDSGTSGPGASSRMCMRSQDRLHHPRSTCQCRGSGQGCLRQPTQATPGR